MSSKQSQPTGAAHEIVLPDMTKSETWFGDKPRDGVETGRRHCLATSIYSGLTVPRMTCPVSVLPRSDYTSPASSSVSSWRKPTKNITYSPIAVQALPCFTRSSSTKVQRLNSFADIQDLGNACDKWRCNGDLRLTLASGSEVSSSSNVLSFRSNCNSSTQIPLLPVTYPAPNLNNHYNSSAYWNSEGRGPPIDVKPPTNVTLNHTLPNGIRYGLPAQQDVVWKHEELSGGVPRLVTKAPNSGSSNSKEYTSQIESNFPRHYSQLMFGSDTVAPKIKKEQDQGKGPSLCAQWNLPSSLPDYLCTMRRNKVSDDLSSKGMISFPILHEVQQSTVRGVEGGSKGFLNPINLTSVISHMNVRNSSMNLPEDEADVPSPLSVTSDGEKIAPKIDVKLPIVAQAENIISQKEAVKLNHIPSLVQMPVRKTNGFLESQCFSEQLAELAAENLVAMSLYEPSCSDDLTPKMTQVSCDSLRWFAYVVTSNAEKSNVPKEGGYGGDESSDDDGADSFELMTLKLKEITPDEYCPSRLLEQGNQNDDERTSAPLLLTRVRRGQGTKRMQRRDFQKEILPGLASLSRNEVNEDFQAFRGLTRTSGRSSKSGSGRRNTGRNVSPCQVSRGAKRLRSLAVSVGEVYASPKSTQPTNTELETDRRNMTGWGRTTRRCRRQRAPSGNVAALLI